VSPTWPPERRRHGRSAAGSVDVFNTPQTFHVSWAATAFSSPFRFFPPLRILLFLLQRRYFFLGLQRFRLLQLSCAVHGAAFFAHTQ